MFVEWNTDRTNLVYSYTYFAYGLGVHLVDLTSVNCRKNLYRNLLVDDCNAWSAYDWQVSHISYRINQQIAAMKYHCTLYKHEYRRDAKSLSTRLICMLRSNNQHVEKHIKERNVRHIQYTCHYSHLQSLIDGVEMAIRHNEHTSIHT